MGNFLDYIKNRIAIKKATEAYAEEVSSILDSIEITMTEGYSDEEDLLEVRGVNKGMDRGHKLPKNVAKEKGAKGKASASASVNHTGKIHLLPVKPVLVRPKSGTSFMRKQHISTKTDVPALRGKKAEPITGVKPKEGPSVMPDKKGAAPKVQKMPGKAKEKTALTQMSKKATAAPSAANKALRDALSKQAGEGSTLVKNMDTLSKALEARPDVKASIDNHISKYIRIGEGEIAVGNGDPSFLNAAHRVSALMGGEVRPEFVSDMISGIGHPRTDALANGMIDKIMENHGIDKTYFDNPAAWEAQHGSFADSMHTFQSTKTPAEKATGEPAAKAEPKAKAKAKAKAEPKAEPAKVAAKATTPNDMDAAPAPKKKEKAAKKGKKAEKESELSKQAEEDAKVAIDKPSSGDFANPDASQEFFSGQMDPSLKQGTYYTAGGKDHYIEHIKRKEGEVGWEFNAGTKSFDLVGADGSVIDPKDYHTVGGEQFVKYSPFKIQTDVKIVRGADGKPIGHEQNENSQEFHGGVNPKLATQRGNVYIYETGGQASVSTISTGSSKTVQKLKRARRSEQYHEKKAQRKGENRGEAEAGALNHGATVNLVARGRDGEIIQGKERGIFNVDKTNNVEGSNTAQVQPLMTAERLQTEHGMDAESAAFISRLGHRNAQDLNNGVTVYADETGNIAPEVHTLNSSDPTATTEIRSASMAKRLEGAASQAIKMSMDSLKQARDIGDGLAAEWASMSPEEFLKAYDAFTRGQETTGTKGRLSHEKRSLLDQARKYAGHHVEIKQMLKNGKVHSLVAKDSVNADGSIEVGGGTKRRKEIQTEFMLKNKKLAKGNLDVMASKMKKSLKADGDTRNAVTVVRNTMDKFDKAHPSKLNSEGDVAAQQAKRRANVTNPTEFKKDIDALAAHAIERFEKLKSFTHDNYDMDNNAIKKALKGGADGVRASIKGLTIETGGKTFVNRIIKEAYGGKQHQVAERALRQAIANKLKDGKKPVAEAEILSEYRGRKFLLEAIMKTKKSTKVAEKEVYEVEVLEEAVKERPCAIVFDEMRDVFVTTQLNAAMSAFQTFTAPFMTDFMNRIDDGDLKDTMDAMVEAASYMKESYKGAEWMLNASDIVGLSARQAPYYTYYIATYMNGKKAIIKPLKEMRRVLYTNENFLAPLHEVAAAYIANKLKGVPSINLPDSIVPKTALINFRGDVASVQEYITTGSDFQGSKVKYVMYDRDAEKLLSRVDQKDINAASLLIGIIGSQDAISRRNAVVVNEDGSYHLLMVNNGFSFPDTVSEFSAMTQDTQDILNNADGEFSKADSSFIKSALSDNTIRNMGLSEMATDGVLGRRDIITSYYHTYSELYTNYDGTKPEEFSDLTDDMEEEV